MPGPTDPDLELASDLVVHAARLVRAVRRAVALPAGVRLLSILDEHGPLGVSRLAVLDRCSQPTMSAAVTAAARRGWVDKQPHPDDARASVVTLADPGRDELARIRRAHGQAVAARIAATPHSREDVATAVAVLRDVLDPDSPAEAEAELVGDLG
ncbi:MarR family winged helix-turn-helix transcriptional regulator [Nocardioides abyssi]|uniref:MarR family transcriptional regulator n=1 Tax=Nocardioides abyssi TaxID=3058370 RepID=A0ABT8EQA6_9ACTN|nr:MarR family transcriptional regulator [Nocardioides abyssi]MDN4160340.1 MarR family transcriptional regulator [Nocardioides abyssi]